MKHRIDIFLLAAAPVINAASTLIASAVHKDDSDIVVGADLTRNIGS